MAEFNLNQTTTTDLNDKVGDYSVSPQTIDGVQDTETTFVNDKWTQYLGYYKQIPEYKTAINAYATWVIGKGYTTDIKTEVNLENVMGWGEDTFLSILWNMLVVKKFAGDSYAEVIRNKEGNLINLKPLDPSRIQIVVDKNGIIKEYRQLGRIKGKKVKTFLPHQIFHLCNDRIADEVHGTSITESIEWVILARQEAMRDWKRLSHRSTIRVMYIDADDTTKLNTIKSEYADAIKNGELMLIPATRGEVEFEDLTLPPISNFLEWIKYLEDIFYKALGVPKIILGGGATPESDSKVSYLTFEQVYVREIEELKADLWNQLALKLEFSTPVSLKDKVQDNELKNTSQLGFQPNDVEAGVGE